MTHSGRKLARHFAAKDNLKSLLLAAITLLLASAVTYLLLGAFGVLLGVGLVLVGSMVSANGQLFLRLQRARPLSYANAPGVVDMVEGLARRANLRAPHLYWLPSPVPNALATETRDGRGALAITQGLLRRLTPPELEGVLAHELAHLKHGDTRLTRWTVSATQTATTLLNVSVWVGLFMTLISGQGMSQWLLLLVLSFLLPLAFGYLQSALSRTREYAADTAAVELTGRPLQLASALAKLERASTPWLHLVFGRRRNPGWLDSHPATTSRIARLRALGTQQRRPPWAEGRHVLFI